MFGPCQRCLEEARVELDGDGREYQAHQPEPGAEEEMTTPYLAGDLLDTDRWAQDTLVLAMPLKVLCREDCAGLCPQCGVDLNVETCACAVREPDERWAKSRTCSRPSRHPADLSSEWRSPTGPRCGSLSGLTIELMPAIWPPAISSARRRSAAAVRRDRALRGRR